MYAAGFLSRRQAPGQAGAEAIPSLWEEKRKKKKKCLAETPGPLLEATAIQRAERNDMMRCRCSSLFFFFLLKRRPRPRCLRNIFLPKASFSSASFLELQASTSTCRPVVQTSFSEISPVAVWLLARTPQPGPCDGPGARLAGGLSGLSWLLVRCAVLSPPHCAKTRFQRLSVSLMYASGPA